MAHATSSSPVKTVTAEAFLADRLAFWDRFTGFTVKTTAALIFFCAWLWWCSSTGFTFLHSITLPVGVAIAFIAL